MPRHPRTIYPNIYWKSALRKYRTGFFFSPNQNSIWRFYISGVQWTCGSSSPDPHTNVKAFPKSEIWMQRDFLISTMNRSQPLKSEYWIVKPTSFTHKPFQIFPTLSLLTLPPPPLPTKPSFVANRILEPNPKQQVSDVPRLCMRLWFPSRCPLTTFRDAVEFSGMWIGCLGICGLGIRDQGLGLGLGMGVWKGVWLWLHAVFWGTCELKKAWEGNQGWWVWAEGQRKGIVRTNYRYLGVWRFWVFLIEMWWRHIIWILFSKWKTNSPLDVEVNLKCSNDF